MNERSSSGDVLTAIPFSDPSPLPEATRRILLAEARSVVHSDAQRRSTPTVSNPPESRQFNADPLTTSRTELRQTRRTLRQELARQQQELAQRTAPSTALISSPITTRSVAAASASRAAIPAMIEPLLPGAELPRGWRSWPLPARWAIMASGLLVLDLVSLRLLCPPITVRIAAPEVVLAAPLAGTVDTSSEMLHGAHVEVDTVLIRVRQDPAAGSTDDPIYRDVVAPASAILMERLRSRGASVRAGDPLVRLALIADARAVVAIGDGATPAPGTGVRLRLAGGQIMTATVQTRAPQSLSASGWIASNDGGLAAAAAIDSRARAILVPSIPGGSLLARIAESLW